MAQVNIRHGAFRNQPLLFRLALLLGQHIRDAIRFVIFALRQIGITFALLLHLRLLLVPVPGGRAFEIAVLCLVPARRYFRR